MNPSDFNWIEVVPVDSSPTLKLSYMNTTLWRRWVIVPLTLSVEGSLLTLRRGVCKPLLLIIQRETLQRHNVEKMSLDWISLFSTAASNGEGKQQYYKCDFIVLLLLGGLAHLVPTLTQIVSKWKREPFKVGRNPMSPVIRKTHYLCALILLSPKHWFTQNIGEKSLGLGSHN